MQWQMGLAHPAVPGELLPGGPAPAQPVVGQAASSGVSPMAPGMHELNYLYFMLDVPRGLPPI